MMILAIDPGTTESGWVLYDSALCAVVEHATHPNENVRTMLHLLRRDVGLMVRPDVLAIERIASYGMAVGEETFETVWWSGRFAEAWGARLERVYRREVKLHLCGSVAAKDANVNQALRDLFGGSKAKGTKKAPGPLYGIKGDAWAALGVAVTVAGKLAEAA